MLGVQHCIVFILLYCLTDMLAMQHSLDTILALLQTEAAKTEEESEVSHPISTAAFSCDADIYTTIAVLYANICPQNVTNFYPGSPNSTAIIA